MTISPTVISSFYCRTFVAGGWALLIFCPFKKVADWQLKPTDILYFHCNRLIGGREGGGWGTLPEIQDITCPASIPYTFLAKYWTITYGTVGDANCVSLLVCLQVERMEGGPWEDPVG